MRKTSSITAVALNQILNARLKQCNIWLLPLVLSYFVYSFFADIYKNPDSRYYLN